MNAEMIRKAGYGLLLGCLTLVSVSCGCRVVIGDLRCEYQVSPLCVDTPSPRFTWAYAGGEEFMQAACRLCVATEPGKLDDPDIWDSGKIVAERPLAVMPDTGALKSRTVYWWRVEAWNEAGERFVSPVATFETALLENSEWQARWITDSCGRDCVPAPMFRRSFPVKEGAVRARLYASAAAYGKFSLNGEPVSDNRLDPGYTHYDRRNLYAVHDVTPLLREGENVLAAVLGNGFYNALQPLSVWNFENARWRNRARMLCELHIDYADGGHEVVCSDSSWRTSADGPYLSNDIYSGDTYDARREIPGWDRPGFDDAAWAQAVEVGAPSPRLKAQAMPPIRVTRELAPVEVRSFGDTVWVFDFGTNISGVCRLAVEGERGTKISLTHGELLQPSGRIEMRNIDIYFHARPGYAFQTDTYVLRGGERECWAPDFTYHGFRCVELVSSAPLKLDAGSLTALAMHTDVEPVGEFACSNPLLNRIWKMTRQSYLNNLMSIPTDCPQREKNGWTADASLALEMALLNYDGITFYEKWLDDFIDNQTPEGRISGIIPTAGWGYDDWIGPVWDASAFIIPYTLYNYYGDLRPIEKMWPLCERYLDFLAAREEADGSVTYGIGDWLSYRAQTPTDYTSTCYYYYDQVLMARFAELLGRDGSRYARKAAELRDLINAKYYDAERGLYANGSQAAQGVALYLGIVPEAETQRVADNLNEMIVANDCFLDFGTIGSKTVLRMLTRYGHVETAYRMAAKTEAPSWGWWVKQGFTTLAETWVLSPEWRDASIDHVFLGDVAAWYVNDLAGINFDPQAPGFGHVVFAPHFVAELDWAGASYRSVRGEIRSEWHRKGGKVLLKVTLPVGTTGEVRIGGETIATVGGGVHEFTL